MFSIFQYFLLLGRRVSDTSVSCDVLRLDNVAIAVFAHNKLTY